METMDALVSEENEPTTDFACPLCGGPLMPIRDCYRCTRCCHSFCESCEGGAGEEYLQF